MKIKVLGSLGNINRYYLPRLIADGHDVTVKLW
ncbi:MAG: nucleoside-diphosphate sugar epimerase [Paenibacillus sp.]|nr:nucleoside-diphosphate sugar epimerase [Paenibacillus sp.]